jgi:hypothetical protein
MLKIPVFRRFEGSILSKDQPLQYSKLRDDLKQQSLDTGNEEAIVPRAFRRMAANSMNGMSPAVFYRVYLILMGYTFYRQGA